MKLTVVPLALAATAWLPAADPVPPAPAPPAASTAPATAASKEAPKKAQNELLNATAAVKDALKETALTPEQQQRAEKALQKALDKAKAELKGTKEAPSDKKPEAATPATPAPAKAEVKVEAKPVPPSAPAPAKTQPSKPGLKPEAKTAPAPTPAPVPTTELPKVGTTPSPAPASSKEAPEVRKAQPSSAPQQVRAVVNLSSSDAEIIAKAADLPMPQLIELLQGYMRKKNFTAADKLVGIVLKKDPSHPGLKQALRDLAEARNEQVGSSSDADDKVADEAESLIKQGKPAAAVAKLQQLRDKNYKGRPFPYLQDLASAYDANGQSEQAEKAYKALVNDSTATEEARSSARLRLLEIASDRALDRGTVAMQRGELEQALRIADGLVTKEPRNWSARLLRADILAKMGKGVEAEKELQALANDPRVSMEARLDAKNTLKQRRIDHLLQLGYQALEQRNRVRAAIYSEQLDAIAPHDPEVVALRADVRLSEGRYEEAILIYEDQKVLSGGRNFDSQPDLARAYEGAGFFLKAQEAWAEVVEEPRYPANQKIEAREHIDVLAQLCRAGSSIEATMVDEEEGRLFSVVSETRSPLMFGGKGQFRVRTTSDYVSLNDSPEIKNAGDDTLFDGEAIFRWYLKRNWYVEGGAGATSNGEGLAHLEFGKVALPGHFSGALRVDWHDRALDSLSLRALDGRQNVVSLKAEGPLMAKTDFYARIYARQVEIDGHEIGTGYGANLEITRNLVEETTNRPEVSIGYFLDYSVFNANTPGADWASAHGGKGLDPREFIENLIDDRYHRQGVQLTFSKHFERLTVTAYGAAGYDFEDKSFVWKAGAMLEYRLSDTWHAYLGAEYESSGRAASRDSGVIMATAGLEASF